MEISISRYYDTQKHVVGGVIEKSDWISYIRSSPLLSAETSPLRGRNPKTGAEILIASRPDMGYFIQGASRVAIQYNNGDLWTDCEWDEDSKPVLSQMANHFGAVLLDDKEGIIKI